MAKRFVTTKVEIEGREETKVVELPSREPAPWGEDAELHVVGQRVPRMDAVEKLTGTASPPSTLPLPSLRDAVGSLTNGTTASWVAPLGFVRRSL